MERANKPKYFNRNSYKSNIFRIHIQTSRQYLFHIFCIIYSHAHDVILYFTSIIILNPYIPTYYNITYANGVHDLHTIFKFLLLLL